MKHVRQPLTLLKLAAASLLATGCVVTTDAPPFAPFGSEVTLSGEWDIDGAAPTLASCGDIVTVRALICETASEANCLANSQLTFSCADGAFNTSPTPVLVFGSYHVVWEALNRSGQRVQASTATRFTAFDPQVVLPIPNFSPGATVFDPSGTAVSLDGVWDVNGAEPTLTSCGDIANVRVVICETSAGTNCWSSPSLTFPCANGGLDTRPTRVLAAGSYHSLWEALDSSGAVLQETSPLPLVVSGHATLATPDFDGALPPTSVTLQVRFQDSAGGPFLTCSAAMIASNQFTYTLHEGSLVSDPVIVPTMNQLCSTSSDVLFTENASFTFDTDPYTLHVTAQDTNGSCTSFWDGKCTFSLTLNASNVVTCNAAVSFGPGC